MACGEKSCCYHIPICGGFCAPTANPDESFWRHFSNEFTLPLAPRYMGLAPCVENSGCCTAVAKLGLPAADRHRKKVMALAAAANVVALILTIFATLGLTMNSSLLQSTHWVHGKGTGEAVEVYIGVSMMSEQIDCEKITQRENRLPNISICETGLKQAGFVQQSGSVYERNTEWKSEGVCVKEYIQGPDREILEGLCKQCKENMLPVTSLILSIVAQLPTLATNLQRATVYGDVNCQATMGVVSNLFSLVTSMMSLIGFRFACWRDLPRSIDGREVQWELGIGFRCLMVATLVKVLDAACHLLLPTPRARWTKPSPEITDVKDYMMLACEGSKYVEQGDAQPVGKPSEMVSE
eukprot:TRINITY_DN76805_c0_g1_i1.p1 TRINITY_DN76805_c0_g1~~TRINITY_DN76805_c0_g1_i1.p1  ORF type:complete len:365 (-),score=39.32 TRINITY_DN76805_c0_g1_i1:120-1178(-)